MNIYIKNADTVEHIWSGQGVQPDEYYLIEDIELTKWQTNSKLLIDIANGIAVVAKDNSGTADITDINEAINFLKGDAPQEVISQTEKTDIILRMACGTKQSDAQGAAQVNILVPGTPGSGDGRHVEGGHAWFDSFHHADVFEVYIIDLDNITGYGAGTVVGTYTEDFSAHANPNNDGVAGWMPTPSEQSVSVKSMGFFGFVPSGFYLVIKGQKGDSIESHMHCNVKWGAKSV